MKRTALRIALFAALAGAASSFVVDTASAQPMMPAFAIGKWRGDAAVPAGTVTVRVIAGSMQAAVTGTDVTLLVNNEPRVARTDAQGRASFGSLPAGATLQAQIEDSEGKNVQSETFTMPADVGARTMLSTKPMAGAGGGGPMMGANGMPEARKASGIPRQHPQEAPATYAVRLTYNNLKMANNDVSDDAPPENETVTLVGYASDNSVDTKQVKVAKDGRAVFENLDPSGSTSYFALAALPRNGGYDRLSAQPIVLDSQVGFRAILSGEKRDATEPLVDDFARGSAIPTPPGKVRITLDGFPEKAETIALYDAVSKKRLAQAVSETPPADPTAIQADTQFEQATDLAAGALAVIVRGGGTPKANDPIPNVAIRVIPADAPEATEGVGAVTGSDGTVQLMVPVTGPQKAIATINGKTVVSEPFDVSKAGGRFGVIAQWGDKQGRPQAVFDVKPGMTLYAETNISGRLSGIFRSVPFQTIDGKGVHVGISIVPRLLFRFSLRAIGDDELLAVQGRWALDNNSWIPYRGGNEGILLPAPHGFIGGILAPGSEKEVAVVPNEGFKLLKPVPPGGRSFIAGFSLPTNRGDAAWSWDLPYGAIQSGMEIKQTPGVRVKSEANMNGETRYDEKNNPWFVIDNVMIPPGHAMVMTVAGLPAAPAWKYWVPRVVGLFVILLVLGGIVFAIARLGAAPRVDTVRARKTALLDELVELERTGKDPKRREQLMTELERIWTA